MRNWTLRVDGEKYPIQMPFGVMIKAVSDGTRAAWPQNEMGEVLQLTKDGVQVQGTGCVTFVLAHKGHMRTVDVDFAKGTVQHVAF